MGVADVQPFSLPEPGFAEQQQRSGERGDRVSEQQATSSKQQGKPRGLRPRARLVTVGGI